MGCPRVYYMRALQCFAHALVYMEDVILAKELFEETSIEKLETFILRKKEQMEEKLFYYDAGRASQCVLEEAAEECCDGFNASIGGINEFEHFYLQTLFSYINRHQFLEFQ